jgi:glucan phosphoethanolaminetransferase (alkaline phosphatase superfamily)
MNKKIAFSIAGTLWVLPVVAFAETKTLLTIIQQITTYFNYILVLLMGFAIVMFVWYVIKYFILSNEDHKEAGMYVMYSVIGFFVILSMWGIVNILQNTFGLQNENNRPATWNSFTNLFPGGNNGGSSTGGDRFDGESGLRNERGI